MLSPRNEEEATHTECESGGQRPTPAVDSATPGPYHRGYDRRRDECQFDSRRPSVLLVVGVHVRGEEESSDECSEGDSHPCSSS